MGEAFKCDKCGKFVEGIPEIVEISDGYRVTGTDTKGKRNYKEFELCEKCHEEIRKFIGE